MTNRTYHYWHVFVPGVQGGADLRLSARTVRSTRRTGSASTPTRCCSIRTDAASSCPRGYNRAAAREHGDNAATAMKSVVVDPGAYDWEGDVPLRRPSSQTIIYEMHVRGFTRHPSSGAAGGDARHLRRRDREDSVSASSWASRPSSCCRSSSSTRCDCPAGHVNYWGYAPVSFFAPHQAYSSRQDPLGPVDEFRDMVKALHRAGIEVILDVVFNHTAEGDRERPDALLPRPRQPRLLHPREATGRATRTTPAAETR